MVDETISDLYKWRVSTSNINKVVNIYIMIFTLYLGYRVSRKLLVIVKWYIKVLCYKLHKQLKHTFRKS